MNNVRVYSEGESVTGAGDDAKLAEEAEGVLAEEADGNTEPVTIGRFAHDSLVPSDNQSGIPDLAVTYSLATTSEGDGYSNAMFSITDDTLSYIGANSGDYESDPRPTHKLKIAASVTIVIDVSDLPTFGAYYYVSAEHAQGGNGGVEYAYSGGTIRKTDVEAGEKRAGEAASVTISATVSGASKEVLIFTAKDTGVYANDVKITMSPSSIPSDGDFYRFTFNTATKAFSIRYDTTGNDDLTLDELIGLINNFPLADIKNEVAGADLEPEALTFLIKGDTGTFADIFTITKTTDAVGASTDFEIQENKQTFAGGVEEIAETVLVAYRKIDVPAGEIYLGDGSKIQFAAENNLRIDATSFVIVDDADGDGTYAVRAVTALPSPSDGKFYVLGTVEPHTLNDAPGAEPTQTGTKRLHNEADITLMQTNEYDYVIHLYDVDETNNAGPAQ